MTATETPVLVIIAVLPFIGHSAEARISVIPRVSSKITTSSPSTPISITITPGGGPIVVTTTRLLVVVHVPIISTTTTTTVTIAFGLSGRILLLHLI
jgi:hypothetical protein